MSRRARILAVVIGSVITACSGETAATGADEPLRVAEAAFKHGELPGIPVAGQPSGGVAEVGARVTAVETAGTVVRPRQVGKAIKGRATEDAYSIGLRLAGVGTGYWVKPLGAPDTAFPGELSWNAVVDFAADLPAGEQVLQVVAFDRDGEAGPQYELRLCAIVAYDDSRNPCDPTVPPAAAVITLSWAVDADLDLAVRTPDGELVDARHPSISAGDAGAAPIAVLAPDSTPECTLDGQRRETLRWESPPQPGPYSVYVNLFEACGQRAVSFQLDTYERVTGEEPGTYSLAPRGAPVFGQLLGASANGGHSTGLFAGTFDFESTQ